MRMLALHQWRRNTGTFLGFAVIILIAACMLGSALTLLFTVGPRYTALADELRTADVDIVVPRAAATADVRELIDGTAGVVEEMEFGNAGSQILAFSAPAARFTQLERAYPQARMTEYAVSVSAGADPRAVRSHIDRALADAGVPVAAAIDCDSVRATRTMVSRLIILILAALAGVTLLFAWIGVRSLRALQPIEAIRGISARSQRHTVRPLNRMPGNARTAISLQQAAASPSRNLLVGCMLFLMTLIVSFAAVLTYNATVKPDNLYNTLSTETPQVVATPAQGETTEAMQRIRAIPAYRT